MFYSQIKIQDCIDCGLKIDGATVSWWMRQNKEARKVFDAGDSVSLRQALIDFSIFLNSSEFIWAHGAAFDLPILGNAYKALSMSIPWDFWAERDTRTLFALAGDIKVDVSAGIEHNALSDATNHARAVIKAYKKIKLDLSSRPCLTKIIRFSMVNGRVTSS